MPDKNIDSIVSNGMWVSVGPSVAYLNGTVKHVTVLDEKSDRSNTGTVYFTDGGQPYTMLQLRSADRVVAESREQFEVPPGTYTLRVVIGNGQTYDLPGTVTVERQRFVQRTVGVIPQSYFASSNK